MRLPDGSPAAGVPVNINLPTSQPWEGTTDQDGALFNTFNVHDKADITVEVSIPNLIQRCCLTDLIPVLTVCSSASNRFLQMDYEREK